MPRGKGAFDNTTFCVVRLQWYGLYHDKPKIGYFMLRVKIANGILMPQQFPTIGEISAQYRRDKVVWEALRAGQLDLI